MVITTTLEWRKFRRPRIRFTGEVGDLNNFLNRWDRLINRMGTKIGEFLLDNKDAEELEVALICRVKRAILIEIQAAQCPRTRCFECGIEGYMARNCPLHVQEKRTGRTNGS